MASPVLTQLPAIPLVPQECKAGTIGETQFDAWLVQVSCCGSGLAGE